MHRRYARLFLLLFVAMSLGSGWLPVLERAAAAHEDDHPDPHDADPMEWEEQVASDARGDVLVHYPGTIDLYYMTIGELFSWSLGESFLFVRIGYNISDEPEDTTVDFPSETGNPLLPDIPEQVSTEPLVMINVTFNISHERTERFSLFTTDMGREWSSGEGRLLADNGVVDGHREVLYISPLRRFGLAEGDTMSDWNITSLREARLVDTMEGYDPLNDYLPRYVPVRPFLEDPEETVQNLPLPVPVPPAPEDPEPPVPVPTVVPIPDPVESVPNNPYPTPGPLGPTGIPYGVPVGEELQDIDPGRSPGDDERAVPIDPKRVAEDPTSGSAWNVTHTVTEGYTRFVVRAEREIVAADNNTVGFVNFSVESRFEETDQTVMMFVIAPSDTRWLMRYGLDMPLGIKQLPAGGRINMSALAVPGSLFATPQFSATFIFLSNWGGFDFATVTFVSTMTAQVPLLPNDGLPDLPDRLIVDLVNPDDHFRVNEPRKIMVQALRGDNGRFQSRMEAVRAYIYPAGENVPQQPYQLKEKDFSDGVYEIDFVFRKPGAWVVHVFFFDYTANEEGSFPSTRFIVRVDYPGQSEPLMPFPLALGSVGLIVAAVMVRERLTKAR